MLQTGLSRQQCHFTIPLWHDGSEGPSWLSFEQRYLIICFHPEIADKDFNLPEARTHDLTQYAALHGCRMNKSQTTNMQMQI